MANLFFDLPVPAADGVGAAVDVTAQGPIKTVTMAGDLRGSIILEYATDGTGTDFAQLLTFSGPGKRTIKVACTHMRVRVNNYKSGAANVDVGGNDAGVQALPLVVPAADGVGAQTDVSALPTLVTLVVGGVFTGRFVIQASEDGVDWVDALVFSRPGGQTKNLTAQFLRVVRSGTDPANPGAASINIAATAGGGGGGGSAAIPNPLILNEGAKPAIATAGDGAVAGIFSNYTQLAHGDGAFNIEQGGPGFAAVETWADYPGGIADAQQRARGGLMAGWVGAYANSQARMGVDAGFGGAALGAAWANTNGGLAEIASRTRGTLAAGYAIGNSGGAGGSAIIESRARGAMAFGYARTNDAYVAELDAGDEGAIAMGAAFSTGGVGDGAIRASSRSSFAQGYVTSGLLHASARGARAQGNAYGGGTVEATAIGAGAFGNTNGLIRAAGVGSHAQGAALLQGSIMAYGVGSQAFGSVVDATSFISSRAVGGFAGGRAESGGSIETTVAGEGAFALGNATDGGDVSSSGDGSLALGKAYGANGSLSASGNGAVAMGYAGAGGAYNAVLEATEVGAFAVGSAYAFDAASVVRASGRGAFAAGYAYTGGTIEATGHGAFVAGYADGVAIRATAINAFQFGPGTNALASSVQIGSAGLRMLMDTFAAGGGAFAQDGDMGVNNAGHFSFQSAGAEHVFSQPAVAGSRDGNAALADLLTQLASMGLIVDNTVV